MEKLLFIDMDALLPALFWGSAVSLLFLLIYHRNNKFSRDGKISLLLILGRICHIFYYFAAFGRGTLPDLLSVNLGMAALYAGYYFEANAILRMIRENSKFNTRFLSAVFGAFILIFSAAEVFAPYGGIRVMTASLGVVAIMALPSVRMLLSGETSVYIRITAIFYTVFLVLLLVRAVCGFIDRDMNILTNNILQSVTFLSLTLQSIIALPSYALIIKDYTDEALIKMATTDRLTGAINRHAFLDEAEGIYRNCKRFRTPVSILFLDIDHFKAINDRFGHAFGDEVLVRIASVIDGCLRESDLGCRYGGEEFVIMLSDADRQAARAVAERIMSGVRGANFENQPGFTFTVSIGIFCGVPSPHTDLEGAIRASDEAMYRAKRDGRDRIVFCDEVKEAKTKTN